MKIIGIDCATQKKNIGLSLATFENGKAYLRESKTAKGPLTVAENISNWIEDNEKVLIAIDAPLGWPVSLGNKLLDHTAGGCIDEESNNMFRRMTDRFVKEKIGKQSLDVGADRIARTAHSALKILGELRVLTDQRLNLCWDPEEEHKSSVIEVYPAATMEIYNILNKGYKDKNKISEREQILNDLKRCIEIDDSLDELLISNADILDSAICILAATDFLNKDVFMPVNEELAKKEGWIWVRKPY
jgi:predicted RNase H-like nuclease